MNYKSYSDLSNDIKNNLHLLRKENFDLVVGIPRSGMIPAYMIALALNTNCTSLPSYIKNEKLTHGITRKTNSNKSYPWDAMKVLVVDDSINGGASLKAAIASIPTELSGRITTLAVYSSLRHRDDVDMVFSYVSIPRMFEWNILHHPNLSQSCIDLDGWISFNTVKGSTNPEKQYYIECSSSTVSISGNKIDTIISGKSEKYRLQIKEWLENQNIQFNQLILLNSPANPRTLIKLKAECYNKSDYWVFLTTSSFEASKICQITRKPVYAVENNKMYSPGLVDALISNPGNLFGDFKTYIKDKAIESGLYSTGGLTNILRQLNGTRATS